MAEVGVGDTDHRHVGDLWKDGDGLLDWPGEFVLPADAMSSSDVAVAFDANTGIPLRAETTHRTEELHDVVLDETFGDDLFAIPDERPA